MSRIGAKIGSRVKRTQNGPFKCTIANALVPRDLRARLRGRHEPRDARAIYAAFAGRALDSSGSDAVQVSKLRTMIRLADHPHSLKLRRVLMDVLDIIGASAPAECVQRTITYRACPTRTGESRSRLGRSKRCFTTDDARRLCGCGLRRGRQLTYACARAPPWSFQRSPAVRTIPCVYRISRRALFFRRLRLRLSTPRLLTPQYNGRGNFQPFPCSARETGGRKPRKVFIGDANRPQPERAAALRLVQCNVASS